MEIDCNSPSVRSWNIKKISIVHKNIFIKITIKTCSKTFTILLNTFQNSFTTFTWSYLPPSSPKKSIFTTWSLPTNITIKTCRTTLTILLNTFHNIFTTVTWSYLPPNPPKKRIFTTWEVTWTLTKITRKRRSKTFTILLNTFHNSFTSLTWSYLPPNPPKNSFLNLFTNPNRNQHKNKNMK